ncbi:MAG: hypothetical protein V4596_10035 [Bdellovibrionota bacterium]
MPELSKIYSSVYELIGIYAKQNGQIETLNLQRKNGKIFLGK